MNMPLVLLNRRRRGGGFSPAALFALDEPGVWYDPSDFSTLFQDNAGTTPVTAVEQSVGLVLDKSQGLVLGPELVTNGDFSGGSTGWTTGTGWTIASGVAVKIAGVSANLDQSLVLVSGRTYQVTYTIISINTAAVFVRLAGATVVDGPTRSTAGTYTERLVAPASMTTFSIRAQSTTNVTIDNISVKELPGNHATQPTAASRPVLSARYNLLTATERFDDVEWTKGGVTVSTNAAVAPDGTSTAEKMVEDTSTGVHRILNFLGVAATSGATYTWSVFVKAAERTIVRVTNNNLSGATFDLSNNAASSSVSSGITAVANAVGNGWFRLSVTGAATTSTERLIVQTVVGGNTSYTGDGTSGILIWGADLRVANDGVGLPVYQRVNTSTDYDTVGFPPYLRFDGSDDFLVTNTITPGTDKAQVFAGVRKLSDAAIGVLVESSAALGSNNGTFAVTAPLTAGLQEYAFGSRGTIFTTWVRTGSTSYPAPTTNVLTGIGDIAADNATLRVNGSQAAQSSADQGTGNYLAYPLYIGRRGGTSLPFNGRLYSLIVRFGANLTADQITQTETWVNGKTKGY